MNLFFLVPIVLVVTFGVGILFKKLGIPSLVGQILSGILLGTQPIKTILFGSESSLLIIDFLAHLAIIFLLFLAGLEIDIKKIRETKRESILVSLSSALLTFIFGFTFLMLLFPRHGVLTALVFGVVLMVTSEATNVKVLMDLNSLDTHLGAVMMSAGMVDNIFVIIFLELLAGIWRGGGAKEIVLLHIELIIFITASYAFFKIVSNLFRYMERKRSNQTELFSFIVISVMLLVALSEALGLGYLLGAIIGGFILQIALRGIDGRHRKDIAKVTEVFALGFILPFFFANVGINFDINSLFSSLDLLVITTLIAFLGKFLGSIIVSPFTRLTLKQLYYVGWAMNSRGATELVIALAAMQMGLIPLDIYSALIAMSIISTIAFPPILARGINRNPGLMNYEQEEPSKNG